MKIQTELVKKLKLKKGCKYIVFFPESTGTHISDLVGVKIPELRLSFLLKDTKGIKVIEYNGKISEVLNLPKEASDKG